MGWAWCLPRWSQGFRLCSLKSCLCSRTSAHCSSNVLWSPYHSSLTAGGLSRLQSTGGEIEVDTLRHTDARSVEQAALPPGCRFTGWQGNIDRLERNHSSVWNVMLLGHVCRLLCHPSMLYRWWHRLESRCQNECFFPLTLALSLALSRSHSRSRQAHLVAAFEQSLGNMTIRLKSLTLTAEQKVRPPYYHILSLLSIHIHCHVITTLL